jgi:release factor glutamine methyltransferase
VIRLAKHIRSTLENHVTLLDLCTGSGCIPLLLCHLLPPGSVRSWGTDVSPGAIALALDNAARCGISAANDALMRERLHNTFEPFEADILSPTFPDMLRRLGPFDLLTSNPPYIPKREYDLLSKSVRDYEDPRALLGDPPGLSTQAADGLSFYHAIARLVNDEHVLKRGGLAVLEVGDGQARAVEEIMQREGGLHQTQVWLDPWGKQRVVLGHKRAQHESKSCPMI